MTRPTTRRQLLAIAASGVGGALLGSSVPAAFGESLAAVSYSEAGREVPIGVQVGIERLAPVFRTTAEFVASIGSIVVPWIEQMPFESGDVERSIAIQVDEPHANLEFQVRRGLARVVREVDNPDCVIQLRANTFHALLAGWMTELESRAWSEIRIIGSLSLAASLAPLPALARQTYRGRLSDLGRDDLVLDVDAAAAAAASGRIGPDLSNLSQSKAEPGERGGENDVR